MLLGAHFCLGAEGMDDPDWRAENVSDLQSKFEGLLGFASNILANTKDPEVTTLERWLLSRLQRRIVEVTQGLEELKTRTALQAALFDTWNDIRYYVQRKGKADSVILNQAVKIWLRLLAPFAPYVCEELWSQTDETGFISVARWPTFDSNKIDVAAEEQENLVNDIIEDTLNILRATKINPSRVCFYVASSWKQEMYRKVLEKAIQGEVKMNEIMKQFASNSDLKPHMKEVASLTPKVIKALSKLSSERKQNLLKIKTVNEEEIIQSALPFLRDRFGAVVSVYIEEDKERYDPKQRAPFALPNQPAIFIE